MSVWNHASSFDAGRGSLRAWLLTSVRNRAIDYLRGRGAHERKEQELPTDTQEQGGPSSGQAADPWREVALSLERDAVRDALTSLPAEQRQVIELAYFGGFTHTQIASMLQLPAGTVKGRMRLGLTKLRLALGDSSGAVL